MEHARGKYGVSERQACRDEYTREHLAIRAARRPSRYEVLEAPADVMLFREIPESIRSDNAPEFVAKELWTGPN